MHNARHALHIFWEGKTGSWIEAGARREIRNDGAHPLVTISVYAPPAY